jgi:hypothetical protein
MKMNNEYNPPQEAAAHTTNTSPTTTPINGKNGTPNRTISKQQIKDLSDTTPRFVVSLTSAFVYVDHMPGY